jgi:hypothetical protein
MNPEGIFRVEYEWAIGGTVLKGTVPMALSNGKVSGQNDELVLEGTYTLSDADLLELRMGARLAQAGPNVQPIPFWLTGTMLDGPFRLVGNYDTSDSSESAIVANCTREK